jgi:hypothetical protein
MAEPAEQALQPTAYSVRYAPASGRGSPPAFGSRHQGKTKTPIVAACLARY